jgi:hypothetical protein
MVLFDFLYACASSKLIFCEEKKIKEGMCIRFLGELYRMHISVWGIRPSMYVTVKLLVNDEEACAVKWRHRFCCRWAETEWLKNEDGEAHMPARVHIHA